MRVLVVEDELKIAEYVQRGLEEVGYAVDTVHTGREVLDRTEATDYDLIVLDILLPVMDGISVCRELRQRTVQTPILMLTARDAVDDRVAGLDAGADDYMVKPFAFKELLARLRALIRRTADTPMSTVLQVADLILDPRTRRVRRGDKTISLTAKEYAVLECLMREPERVMSRTEISEHVWSHDALNQSNVVEVYIRNLRRKIEDPFQQKLIHTMRGMGYCLSKTGD